MDIIIDGSVDPWKLPPDSIGRALGPFTDSHYYGLFAKTIQPEWTPAMTVWKYMEYILDDAGQLETVEAALGRFENNFIIMKNLSFDPNSVFGVNDDLKGNNLLGQFLMFHRDAYVTEPMTVLPSGDIVYGYYSTVTGKPVKVGRPPRRPVFRPRTMVDWSPGLLSSYTQYQDAYEAVQEFLHERFLY